MIRPAVCETCGEAFESGQRGVLPKYCPACRYLRNQAGGRRWKLRNSDRMKAYKHGWHLANREVNLARSKRRQVEKAPEIRKYRRRLYVERQQATNTAAVQDYRRRHPGKHAEIENRRRARLLNAFVEPIEPAAIRERDGSLCGICGLFVAVETQSLDHIVPLSRGGTHERSNIQLAHRVCNSRKGDRMEVALAS